MAGARGYEIIAQWIRVQEKEDWYLLGYFRTPPKEGAFRYLISKVDPETLEAALREGLVKIRAKALIFPKPENCTSAHHTFHSPNHPAKRRTFQPLFKTPGSLTFGE